MQESPSHHREERLGDWFAVLRWSPRRWKQKKWRVTSNSCSPWPACAPEQGRYSWK